MGMVEKHRQMSDVAKALGYGHDASQRLKQYFDKYISAFASSKLGGANPLPRAANTVLDGGHTALHPQSTPLSPPAPTGVTGGGGGSPPPPSSRPGAGSHAELDTHVVAGALVDPAAHPVQPVASAGAGAAVPAMIGAGAAVVRPGAAAVVASATLAPPASGGDTAQASDQVEEGKGGGARTGEGKLDAGGEEGAGKTAQMGEDQQVEGVGVQKDVVLRPGNAASQDPRVSSSEAGPAVLAVVASATPAPTSTGLGRLP
ncbi:hypothetical protein T484DRAFT_3261922 [Baffinella frigidus]|nr:hypothetical protein T484DRAFT_3261922 [Cryptophyta sp. CCMP2293]